MYPYIHICIHICTHIYPDIALYSHFNPIYTKYIPMVFLAMMVGKGLTKEVKKQMERGEEKENEGGAGC